jgi:hypothetical protein
MVALHDIIVMKDILNFKRKIGRVLGGRDRRLSRGRGISGASSGKCCYLIKNSLQVNIFNLVRKSYIIWYMYNEE